MIQKKETWYEAYFKYGLDEDFVGPIDFDPHIGQTKIKFPDLDSLRTAVEGCWKSCRVLEAKFVKCECKREEVAKWSNTDLIKMREWGEDVWKKALAQAGIKED